MNRFYLFMLTILVLPGCNNSGSSISIKPVFNGTAFECEIWDVVPGEFGQEIGQTKIKGKDYLYFLNTSSQIILYDMEGNKDSIQLNGYIQHRTGFMPGEVMGYCLAMDHLWISSPASDSIYKISLDLKMVTPFFNGFVNDRKELGIYKGVGLLSCKRHSVVSCGDNIMLPIYQHYENSSKRDEVPPAFTTVGCFNTEESKLALNMEIATLPSDYHNQNMYINSSSYTSHGDSLIVNYPYSDSVDIYYGGTLLNRCEMKSAHSTGFKGMSGLSLDIMAVKEHLLMHSRYVETLYDPYRNLYYRTFLVETNNDQGKIVSHEKWMLMVYDHKLRFVDEFEFKTAEFSASGIYVLPEGVLLRDFRNFDAKNPSKAQFELLTWEETDS